MVDNSVQNQQKKQLIYFHHLPAELQPVLLEANNLFRLNCLLKVQLNDLPDEAEDAALKIQIKIADNWKANELCWKKIDYYMENKQLPKEAKSEFDDLTAAELVKRQQYHFAAISKLSKRLKENRAKLLKVELVKEKSKLERAIAKQESDLLKKNEELQTLTRLVNGN